jgi:hypothetical protein
MPELKVRAVGNSAARDLGKLAALSFGDHRTGEGLRPAKPQVIRAGRVGGLPFDSLVADLFSGCLPATKICYGECFAAREAFSEAQVNFGVRVRNVLDPALLAHDLRCVPTSQAFMRTGWNSDLSWGWNDEDALKILELVGEANKHPVVLTKAFTILRQESMQRLSRFGTELRVCVSAFDTDAQLTHRIGSMLRYREQGGLAVPVVMSTRFRHSILNHRQDAIVQQLVHLDLPGAENSIRFHAASPVRPALELSNFGSVAGSNDLWAGRLYADTLLVPTLSSVGSTYEGVAPYASQNSPDRLRSLFADPVPTNDELLRKGVASKPRCAGVPKRWTEENSYRLRKPAN